MSKAAGLKLLREYVQSLPPGNQEAALRMLKKGMDEIVQDFHRRHDILNTRYVELQHNTPGQLYREYRAQYVDQTRPADVTISILTRNEFLSRQGIHSDADLDDAL